MKRRPVVLATGGTGGHVFPAEALASELLGRGRNLVLVTDVRGASFGGALGRLPTYKVSAGTPSQGSVVARARGIIATVNGTLQARRMLEWLQPAVVVGFGGYASLPTVLAATTKRIPTVLHEQNAVLGRANRLLASRVTSLVLTFPATQRLHTGDHAKVEIVGNPVRLDIRALRASEYVPPAADAPFNLLVLGGSQGASVFATLIPEALAGLPAAQRARVRVVQQCRPEDLGLAENRYKTAGIAAELAVFFIDVPRRMAAAHLMVCRAGASTVGEIAVAGRPAILVPFPFAADDHQSANARALTDSGAGWTFRQRALTPEILRAQIARLMEAPADLAAAAAAARTLGRPDAARALATLVEEVIARTAPVQLVQPESGRRANGGGAA
ncbi:MAG: undecaprenyldiphospho-muramoylpentapeptide beta-N-acetylglucosaminyltransferase [Alphaproteobacteria bacterium]|nr:undecaprenyldiphospho-muramoylpentapeptide beta-N-acetylglucosaminyltransferase [Alphaproteobacteria bacterium]